MTLDDKRMSSATQRMISYVAMEIVSDSDELLGFTKLGRMADIEMVYRYSFKAIATR